MLKEVSVEIIRKCPNKCLHCSSLSDENCKEILDYDRFVAIVRDAAILGATTICLSGGEPFLHTRFSDMIRFVASLGLQTYVYTSGIVFDQANQRASINKDVLKEISSKITKLIFNIEAATSSTYNEIMGTTDCFGKMKQSIYDAQNFSITTEAHFVPMSLNVGEIEAVIDLCRDLKISKLSFLRLVLHGRAKENEDIIALTDEELIKLKFVLVSLKEQPGIDIRVGVPLSNDNTCHKCEAANGKINIKYDGNVFPCEVFKNNCMSYYLKEVPPENIYNKSLIDIYNNSTYLNTVRNISREFSCNEHCETCIGQHLIMKTKDSNH